MIRFTWQDICGSDIVSSSTAAPSSGYGYIFFVLAPKICTQQFFETRTLIQAAIKTIADEDKYFSRVSLRLVFVLISPSSNWKIALVKVAQDVTFLTSLSRMPSLGINVKSSKVDLPKTRIYTGGDPSAQPDTSLEVPLDGWDGINLEYRVDWPLQLFFTQEVLSK